jgi:peptidoglycan hydrolase-like protein with peptidoglycan-binding domain
MAHKHILLKINDGINDETPAVVKEVEILQTVLKDWSELDKQDIDGKFGNKTDKAVKDFQGKNP